MSRHNRERRRLRKQLRERNAPLTYLELVRIRKHGKRRLAKIGL